MQPLYSEPLISYHRRLLMKLYCVLYPWELMPLEILLVSMDLKRMCCLMLMHNFRRAKDFGGGVFSLAATVMSDLYKGSYLFSCFRCSWSSIYLLGCYNG
ncbi:E3 ubiquitin-protein ligase UPL2 [Spatholobus suberectus]|nr:E3 ubiquitin-protein ligase UPL2 [Spatholobus suberectus]